MVQRGGPDLHHQRHHRGGHRSRSGSHIAHARNVWDINFNPVVDRIRVVNDQDENARLVPDGWSARRRRREPVASPSPWMPSPTPIRWLARRPRRCTRSTRRPTVWPHWWRAWDAEPQYGRGHRHRPAWHHLRRLADRDGHRDEQRAFAVLRPVSGARRSTPSTSPRAAPTLVGAVGDGTLAIDDIAIVDPGLTSLPRPAPTRPATFDLVLLAEIKGRAGQRHRHLRRLRRDHLRRGLHSARRRARRRCVVPLSGIGGPVIGAGVHTFQVRLLMNDGSVVQRIVTWTVVATAEP